MLNHHYDYVDPVREPSKPQHIEKHDKHLKRYRKDLQSIVLLAGVIQAYKIIFFLYRLRFLQ